jgi:hypothetical protein
MKALGIEMHRINHAYLSSLMCQELMHLWCHMDGALGKQKEKAPKDSAMTRPPLEGECDHLGEVHIQNFRTSYNTS